MTNGHIDEAELDLLLKGTDRAIDRYLVTSMRELRVGLRELKGDVSSMREVCEERGRMCPGMHSHMADPVTEPPTADAPKLSRETWVMWATGTNLLRGILLPIVVVLATLVITGKL